MKDAFDTEGWIEWHGGECPVHPETNVHIRFRLEDDFVVDTLPSQLDWEHDGSDGDIVAYRVIPEDKPRRKFWLVLSGSYQGVVYLSKKDAEKHVHNFGGEIIKVKEVRK